MVPKSAEIAVQAARRAESESPVKPFSEMSPAESEDWDRSFVAALQAGDDSAARVSLGGGVPIYYLDEDTPIPGVIKEYPDGTKELVALVNGAEEFLRRL
jgi:hypothetical protein